MGPLPDTARLRLVPAAVPAGFELLEHTADMGVRAWGPSLADAFVQAARGMFAIMVDLSAVRERLSRRVEVSADDVSELLVRWLNALAFFTDAESLVFSRFDIERFDGRSLAATAHGETLDVARHAPRAAVKSATYHWLEVDPGPPATVRVLFDI